MSVNSRKFTAVGLLCWAVPLTLNFVAGFIAAASQETSAAFNLLVMFAPGLFFYWWLQRDNQMTELRGVVDIGYAVLLVWVLLMPYYLLKTRGIKALLFIGGFITAYFLAVIAGVAVGVLLVG